MKFKQCPDCGAALDPCEKCDCQNEKKGAPAATGTPLGGNDWRRDSAFSLADPFRDVKNLLRLKEIREDTGAMAKDVAMIVRDHFPKFNRQLLSQCEHYDEYGVIIHPDGLKAICEAYGIPLTAVPDIPITVEGEGTTPKKAENRKLGRKVTFRVTNGDFEVLQKRVQEDGFDSVQAWLYAKITELLGGAADAEHS